MLYNASGSLENLSPAIALGRPYETGAIPSNLAPDKRWCSPKPECSAQRLQNCRLLTQKVGKRMAQSEIEISQNPRLKTVRSAPSESAFFSLIPKPCR